MDVDVPAHPFRHAHPVQCRGPKHANHRHQRSGRDDALVLAGQQPHQRGGDGTCAERRPVDNESACGDGGVLHGRSRDLVHELMHLRPDHDRGYGHLQLSDHTDSSDGCGRHQPVPRGPARTAHSYDRHHPRSDGDADERTPQQMDPHPGTAIGSEQPRLQRAVRTCANRIAHQKKTRQNDPGVRM